MPGDISAGGSQNLIGHSLGGRYDIVSRLGKGGMAVVYSATDRSLGRTVAIKVLRTDVAKDPIAAKRLVREARAAGQLHHPNIITMHDVGDSDGMVFIVMEVLQGRELSELMDEKGPLGLVRSIEIARQTASALAVAHAHRIIHRDIKPENLFVSQTDGGHDHVKVLDFSIAKLPTNMVTAAFTRAGSVFGTPHYMAPEQVEGREVSPQTDIYALGAVLFESLLGEPPFDGDSVIDILLQHVRGTAKRLDFDGRPLPPGLADLVESMLAKKESDRPTSAEEVERQLARCLAAARVIEGSGATTEMNVVETEAVAADDGFNDSDATFQLKGDAVAAIRAAADAANAASLGDWPSGPMVVDRSAARSAPEQLPTNLDLPDDLPGAMGGAPSAPAEVDWNSVGSDNDPGDFSGRTMMGHGLAAQVRAEAARIEAERAAKAEAPALGLPPASALPARLKQPAAPSVKQAAKPAPPPPGRAQLPTLLAGESRVSAPTAAPVPSPSAARPSSAPPSSAPPSSAPPSSAPPSSAPPSSAPPTASSSLPRASSARHAAARVQDDDPSGDASRAASAATIAVSAEDQAALAEALGVRKAAAAAQAKRSGPPIVAIAIGAVVVVGVLIGALFVFMR